MLVHSPYAQDLQRNQKTPPRKRCVIKAWTGWPLEVVGLAGMKLRPLYLFFVLGGLAGSHALAASPEREKLFSIPTSQEMPFHVQVLSQSETEGVLLSEIFFDGAPLGGKPTRIYAWYARPKADGKYPAVVQLHGAALQTLSSEAAISYAKAGYGCLSIDWCGAAKSRPTPRKPPFSEFEATSGLATAQDKKWHTEPVETNHIINGIRFVRRGFAYLRSLPEVDSTKLCISGMSAGAHLTLLVLGVEPEIRAAAVKYGSGYIRELNWGGYFGPVSLTPKEEYEPWLEVHDPKHGFKDIRSATLVLSGTDDIFFWMPAVLATWRALPEPKRLWMRPNDNHEWVGNEEMPRRWFDYILKGAPAWPEIGSIQTAQEANDLIATTTTSGSVAKVTFWYKVMPVGRFITRRGDKGAPTGTWVSAEAANGGNTWKATLPAVAPGDQMVIYANAEGEQGITVSSDTLEIPVRPTWRSGPEPQIFR